MLRFTDRRAAGRLLAVRLAGYRGERPVVVAMPRGGVPVGFEIARILDAPLDVVLVRKIGAPHQPELAIGALADGDQPRIVLNDEILRMLGIPEEFLRREVSRQIEEIRRREALYRAGRPRVPLEDRTVILVDDGIATGATTRAAIHAVRQLDPRSLVLAAPVAPRDTVERLRREVDQVVCLHAPADFGAVGSFYDDFRQTSDEEVIALLEEANRTAPAA